MVKGTFLGEKLAQTEQAIGEWEKFLASINFRRIIELGTWWGNFSLYLFLFCLNRKVDFITYDINKYRDSDLKRFLNFGAHFRQKDIFESAKEIIGEIIKSGITILFCDNGDKAKELKLFSSHLKPGDFIVVHDWGSEVFLNDVKDLELKEISGGDSMTKFFRK